VIYNIKIKKKLAILGIFGDIGTFGDFGTGTFATKKPEIAYVKYLPQNDPGNHISVTLPTELKIK
jgi:hypothetical protein